MRFESKDFIKSHRQWRESRENPMTKTTDKIKRKNNSKSNSILVQKYNDRSGCYYLTKLQQQHSVASINDEARNDDDDNDNDNDNLMRNYFDKRRSSISRDDDDNVRHRREKEEEKVVLVNGKVIKKVDENDARILSGKELEYLKRSRLKKKTSATNNDSYIKSGSPTRDLYNGISTDQEHATGPTSTTNNNNNNNNNIHADDNNSTQSDYYYTTTTDDSKTASSESNSNKGWHLESFTDDFVVLYEECSNKIRNVSVNEFLNVNDQIRGKKSHSCTRSNSEQEKRKEKASCRNNYNSKEREVKVMKPGLDTIVDAAILWNILPNHVWYNYFLNDSHDALIEIQKRASRN